MRSSRVCYVDVCCGPVFLICAVCTVLVCVGGSGHCYVGVYAHLTICIIGVCVVVCVCLVLWPVCVFCCGVCVLCFVAVSVCLSLCVIVVCVCLSQDCKLCW